MGLEIGHALLLIERHGADIDTGRVQMGGGQMDAVCKALLANDRQHNRLFAVDTVNTVAGFERHAAPVGCKARFLRQLDHRSDRVTLGLAHIQEGLIPFRILRRLFPAGPVKARLFVVKKFF